jgi:hypothetical protein
LTPDTEPLVVFITLSKVNKEVLFEKIIDRHLLLR